MADAHIQALRSSVTRLHDLAAQIGEAELTGRAYPAEWSIAQVLSHLGSGAVIMRRGLEDTVAGRPTPDDFAPGVWDVWNAKPPAAQRDDALVADAELLERIEATDAEDRDRFAMSMGPMDLGFTEFVGMRLNEHAFHTWDIEVVDDPRPPSRRRSPRSSSTTSSSSPGSPPGPPGTPPPSRWPPPRRNRASRST